MPTPTHNDFDVGDLLDALYEQEANKPWERTLGVYHPSSMKGCKRALYYDRIVTADSPVKPVHVFESESNAIFELGHGLHARVQEQYSRHPGFRSEVKINVPELHIAGSVDGVFDVEEWVLEIKSIGDASFRTCVKPKIEHIWQVHCYMYATGMRRVQLLYVNRNTGQKRVFRLQFDQAIWDKVLEVITEVEAAVAALVPPEQEVNKFYCRTCKFLHICKPAIGGKTVKPVNATALIKRALQKDSETAVAPEPEIPTVPSSSLSPNRAKIIIRRTQQP